MCSMKVGDRYVIVMPFIELYDHTFYRLDIGDSNEAAKNDLDQINRIMQAEWVPISV